MKIVIYSKTCKEENDGFLSYVVNFLLKSQHEVLIYGSCKEEFPNLHYIWTYQDLRKEKGIDFFFSLGGDGTFLDAAELVGDLNIPIVGINTGRIGFLTGIHKDEFEKAFAMLQTGKYQLEERSLLHVETTDVTLPCRFALNDITVQSSGETSLSTIKVWINEKEVNTYWADGLIVATPTGSTAYSLSCGGPILLPTSQVNVITPIASHSLSVRPIVVPSDQPITLTIGGRSESFILTVDSHRILLPNPATIKITKETFVIKTVRFDAVDFFSVIREKLMWGMDKRNL